jgi:hypothetical protein
VIDEFVVIGIILKRLQALAGFLVIRPGQYGSGIGRV